MTAYLAVAGARFRTLLQYRAAAVAGAFTQLFWGIIRVMIFTAFYRSSALRQPLPARDMATYIWLGQAMLGLLPWNVDPDVRALIRTGDVCYEMLRPVDVYGFWYARALAQRTAPTLLRALPIFVVATLVFAMRGPASPAAALAWLAASAGAALLGAAFTVLITLSMMWTVAGEGIVRLGPGLVYALSGMLVPLPLMPAFLQPALRALPFRDMMDTPTRLYLGLIPARDLGFVLAHEIAWTLALAAAGRMLFARAARRLVIQGG